MAANEIFSSFYTNIQDRLKNPFYGAFIISWLGWNWKFIILLLYGEPTYDKIITHIDKTGPIVLFLLPLIFAALFVFGGPWLTLYIQKGKNRITLKSKEYIFNQQKTILESKKELLTLQAENKFIDDRVKLEYDKEKVELTEKENKAKLEDEFRTFEVGREDLEIKQKTLLEKEEGFAKTEHDLKNAIKKIAKLEIDQKQKNEKVDSLFNELLRAQTETEEIKNENKILAPELYKSSSANKANPEATPTDSQEHLRELKHFLKAEDLKEENLYI